MKLINVLYNHTAISLCMMFLITLLMMSNHLIFTLRINNTNMEIDLKIKSLFKLINIKKQIYPPKKQKKKKEKRFYLLKILKTEYASILGLVKKLKVQELYSDLEFGNTNFYITVYVDTLINFIYGNVSNIINSKTLYLNFKPDFLEDKMKGTVKIHIRFKLISMISMIPSLVRITKNIIHLKKGDIDDGDKLNTKYYGHNSGNN